MCKICIPYKKKENKEAKKGSGDRLVICFSVYFNKHLKLHVTNIVSDNFFFNKICNESFLTFEI